MTEVHEQTKFTAGCVEIVQELRAVLIDQRRNSFDFDNDFAVTNEIGRECLNKRTVADIAGSAVVSRKKECFAIQIRFPGTRGAPVRESRSLYLYRRQNTRRRWRSFPLCKSNPTVVSFVSFVCFVG
jgi:hypothetical protein